MGGPGNRVEPLQAEQSEGEQVCDEIARAVMGKLMLERELPLMLGEQELEIGRDRDHPVEDPERERPADFAASGRAGSSRCGRSLRVAKDRRALAAEGEDSGREQSGRDSEPQHQQDRRPAAGLLDQRRLGLGDAAHEQRLGHGLGREHPRRCWRRTGARSSG